MIVSSDFWCNSVQQDLRAGSFSPVPSGEVSRKAKLPSWLILYCSAHSGLSIEFKKWMGSWRSGKGWGTLTRQEACPGATHTVHASREDFSFQHWPSGSLHWLERRKDADFTSRHSASNIEQMSRSRSGAPNQQDTFSDQIHHCPIYKDGGI